MKQKLLITSVILGMTFAGGGLTSSSVLAASTSCSGTQIGNLLLDQGTDQDTFTTNCNTTPIGVVQGRPGVLGAGDYEIAIGLNGAQAGLADQMQLTWLDETVYNWTVEWNPLTNTATFSLANSTGNPNPTSIDYTFNLSEELDIFNAFGIIARADDPGTRIDAGTTMTISINSVTTVDQETLDNSITETPNLSVTATSTVGTADNFQKHFYTLSHLGTREISQLQGTFQVNWDSINPQAVNARSGGFGFYLQLFDPPPAPAVPESSSIIGLLTVGCLGVAGIFKRQKNIANRQ